MAAETLLRVSAAALNRVVFARPGDGVPMLALERRTNLMREDGRPAGEGPRGAAQAPASEGQVGPQVRAQPFGGALRILRPGALSRSLGAPLRYDSPRSAEEQDLRILIPPASWEHVKQFCLRQLASADKTPGHFAAPPGPVLEDDPHRELAEEFADALGIDLSPAQYRYRPEGFVIENEPFASDNVYARGAPTARLYRIFAVEILDPELCARLLENSAQFSDTDLQTLALRSPHRRANAALCLPLEQVTRAYLDLPPARRYATITAAGHALDASVAAVLPGVEVPQYERIND